MEKITTLGRSCYALALVAYGAQFLICADAVAKLAPSWPASLPGQPFTVYATGLILIMAGGAILLGKRARPAALLMGGLIFLWIVTRNLPPMLVNLADVGARNNACEAFAICAGALLVARSSPREKSGADAASARLDPVLEILLRLGPYLLAAGLICFGWEHIQYAGYVATLVPAWIPGHLFWAYFCGVALIAAGAGIFLGVLVHWAALLSGVMILLFGVLVNAPRIPAALHNPDEWTSFFHTLAWSGAAFVLAGIHSRRRDAAAS